MSSIATRRISSRRGTYSTGSGKRHMYARARRPRHAAPHAPDFPDRSFQEEPQEDKGDEKDDETMGESVRVDGTYCGMVDSGGVP